MRENLFYYLLRAIGACDVKTYRMVDVPDDMASVRVEVEFLFEKWEIRTIEQFVKEWGIDDIYTENVLNMCEELYKVLNTKNHPTGVSRRELINNNQQSNLNQV